MAYQARSWRMPLRVLALVVAAAAIPLPGLAGETSQQTVAPGLRASATRIAAATPLTLSQGQLRPSARRSEQASQAGREDLGSTSFFRTPIGMTVIAVVGAGALYAVYSAKHDRIRSPGR